MCGGRRHLWADVNNERWKWNSKRRWKKTLAVAATRYPRRRNKCSFAAASQFQSKFYLFSSINIMFHAFGFILHIHHTQCHYSPACIPKPGPFGSSDNDVGSPNGSDAYRPLRGPGRGDLPSIKSCNISSVSFSLKSSCKSQIN